MHSRGHSDSTIRTGKFAINLDDRVVSVGDKPVHLTGKEYGVLELLCRRKGATVTKEMLLNHLYGGYDEAELRVIDSYVANLRRKLVQATGGQHYIETVWGRGYALRDPTGLPAVEEYPVPWTTRRKAAVVAAVQSGEITVDEALQRHQLSEEEFRNWRRLYEAHGLPGLRATRVQQYQVRRPRPTRPQG